MNSFYSLSELKLRKAARILRKHGNVDWKRGETLKTIADRVDGLAASALENAASRDATPLRTKDGPV